MFGEMEHLLLLQGQQPAAEGDESSANLPEKDGKHDEAEGALDKPEHAVLQNFACSFDSILFIIDIHWWDFNFIV